MRTAFLVLMVAVSAAGCGARVLQDGADRPGGGGGAASVADAGSDPKGSSRAGSASAGDDNNTSSDLAPGDPCIESRPLARLDCVVSCAEPVNQRFLPVCTASGQLVCPLGSVALQDCSAGSCARRLRWCCDVERRTLEPAACNETGTQDGCPATLVDYDQTCRGDVITSSSCQALSGHPCFAAAQTCRNVPADAASCDCVAKPSGELAWACFFQI